jgi:hypothetical protein
MILHLLLRGPEHYKIREILVTHHVQIGIGKFDSLVLEGTKKVHTGVLHPILPWPFRTPLRNHHCDRSCFPS